MVQKELTLCIYILFAENMQIIKYLGSKYYHSMIHLKEIGHPKRIQLKCSYVSKYVCTYLPEHLSIYILYSY